MRRLNLICCAFVLVFISTQKVRANPFATIEGAKAAQANFPNAWIFVTKDKRFFVVPEKAALKSAKLKALMGKGVSETAVVLEDISSVPFNEALKFLDAKLVKDGIEKWKKETFNLVKSDLSNLFQYTKLANLMGIPSMLYACIDLHRFISDAMVARVGFNQRFWQFADEFEKVLSDEQKHFVVVSVLQDWSRLMPVVSSLRSNSVISALAVDSKAERIAVGARDGVIKIWNDRGNKSDVEVSTINTGHSVSSLAFCPKDNCLAASGGEMARVFQLAKDFQLERNPKLISSLKSSSLVNAVAFSSDGQYLGVAMQDGTATLFSMGGAKQPVNFRHGFNLLTAIAFSPDNKLVATGSSDGNVKVWNITSLDKPLVTFLHGGAVSSIVFSSDSQMLLTGSNDKKAQIWEIKAKQNPHRKALFSHSGNVESAAFSPNGKWVATGIFDEPARLWLADGPKSQKPVLLSHLGKGSAFVNFSPDGSYLVVTSSPHEVRFALLPDPSRIDVKTAYLIKYITAQNIRDKKLLSLELQHMISRNPYVEGLLFPKQ